MSGKVINLAEYTAQVFQIPAQNATESTASIDPMELHARNYRTIQAQIKALEEQQDLIKAEMIAEMDARQAEEVRAGEYTIRYKLVESNRVDTAALKAAGIYDQYTKKSTAIRFTVS